MAFSLREFDPSTDYEPLSRIASHWFEPKSGNEFRSYDENTKEHRAVRRKVAVDRPGSVVGIGSVVHRTLSMPDMRLLRVLVDPDLLGQGIGREIAAWVLPTALEGDPKTLYSAGPDWHEHSVAIAQRWGFEIDRQYYHSYFDLEAFDSAEYRRYVERAEAMGVRFFTYADTPQGEPEQRRMFELHAECVRDIPGMPEGWVWTFQEYLDEVFARPEHSPDQVILANVEGEWAGLAIVLKSEKGQWWNDFTGTAGRFRGHGIATALKVLATELAISKGAGRIYTENDSLNGPMLSVNAKFAYVRKPGVYRYKRDVREPSHAPAELGQPD